MKRIISICLICITIFLVSCSDGSSKNDTVSPQLTEGYYSGDKCTMHVLFTGSNTEISYNVAFYNNDTGFCYYQGSALSVEENDDAIIFTDYNHENSEIKLLVDDDAVYISCDMDSSMERSLLCGDYTWYGKDWISRIDQEKAKITCGVYSKAGYNLYVEEVDGKTSFIIADISEDYTSNQDMVIYSASTTAEIGDTVKLTSDGLDLSFVSSYDENSQYIYVTDLTSGSNANYLGKYTLNSNDYFTLGEYQLDEWTLKYTKRRDKENKDDYYFIIEYTITNPDGEIVWNDSYSFLASSHLRSVSFDNNQISLYKGVNDSLDYVDIICFNDSIPSGRYTSTDISNS